MEFRIADTFTDSLAKLAGDEQKAAKTTARPFRCYFFQWRNTRRQRLHILARQQKEFYRSEGIHKVTAEHPHELDRYSIESSALAHLLIIACLAKWKFNPPGSASCRRSRRSRCLSECLPMPRGSSRSRITCRYFFCSCSPSHSAHWRNMFGCGEKRRNAKPRAVLLSVGRVSVMRA